MDRFRGWPKIYVVIDAHKNGRGDQFEGYYPTAEEATEAAKMQWSYLTKAERARRVVFSGVIDGNAIDEDGIPDLGNLDVYPGNFDSSRADDESEG